jgi:hypothetical protein
VIGAAAADLKLAGSPEKGRKFLLLFSKRSGFFFEKKKQKTSPCLEFVIDLCARAGWLCAIVG